MRSDTVHSDASAPTDSATNTTSQLSVQAENVPAAEAQTTSSSLLNSENINPSSARRPAPSPANSPEPKAASRFPSALSTADLKRSSAYKRARTVSPIIDENSSDVENDVRSTYSRSTSDFGEADAVEPTPSTQPTPLRQSISSSEVVNAASTSTHHHPNQAMSASDQNIEGLLTEQSLSLNDGAAAGASASVAGASDTVPSEQPPSYQQALKFTSNLVDLPSDEPRPTGQEQLNTIRPMKNRPLRVGDKWYLVSRVWYRRWDAACSASRDSDPAENAEHTIGPIDNTSLYDYDSIPSFVHLRRQITEHVDYEMLPEEGWDLLVDWYGSKGPTFERDVIEGLNEGQESVEFYPPTIRFLKLKTDHNDDTPRWFSMPSCSMSVSSSISDLKAEAKKVFQLDSVADVDIRLLHFPDPTDDEARTASVSVDRIDADGVDVIDAGEDKPDTYNPNATLKSVGVDEIEMNLLVETRQSGRWQSDPAPVEASSTSNKGIFAQQGDFFSNLQQSGSGASTSATGAASSSSEAQGRVTRSQTAVDRTFGRSRGLRGLNNLGNTCFMNSALQCLSNTYELQQYFVSGAYKEELNTDNPLGMGGAIAEAFGNLIGNIWNGQGGSFWPREFKFALSRFAPQFSGYAQHDTQELLAFLLDGLHEDLNRILKKPYIEAPDWEGGDQRELVAFAKRQWDIYKARNDSVIVDLFQGQYRSTLICPECSKVSIKFDPFMYLTLPIPNKKMWRGQVYFVPLSPNKPMQKFQVQLPAGTTVSKLRQKVAAQFGVETKRLICGEVWHHRVYKWIEDYEPLIDIKDGDFVYFWEVPAAPRVSKQRGYRYHRTVEDAEDALDIQEEEHAILPVFANFASGTSGSSSQAFVSRRARQDAVGIPFFIAVPKSEVNDVQAVRRHVLDGFSRFATTKDDLRKAVEDADADDANVAGVEQTTAAPMSDWEMVDDSTNGSDAVEVVAPSQMGDSDLVTEIREDGETVVVPGVTTSSVEDGEGKQSVQTSKSAVRSEPVLRIRFSVAEIGQGGLPKGSESSAENLSEELEERHARLAKRSTATASSSASDRMAEDESQADADSSLDDASTTKNIPLVFTGGAIVCTWSQSINERGLLAESDSGQLWGEYEEVIDEDIRARENAGPAKPKNLSIEDCMDEFTKEEQLGEDDPWYCPSCKDFRQATKKFDLWKAPDILVVHLKRFSAGRHSRDKLNMLVDFRWKDLILLIELKVRKRCVEYRPKRKRAVKSFRKACSDPASCVRWKTTMMR